jgi:hypothetical protein
MEKLDSWISVLDLIHNEFLPHWVNHPDMWNTLHVTYEKPHVERLWKPFSYNKCSYRVFLHVIYPCERHQALWHPHPWPSIIRVLPNGGMYEMGVGSDERGDGSPSATTVLQMSGTMTYAMLDPKGWHYVRPISLPSYSIMITGDPWGNPPGYRTDFPKQDPLTSERVDQLLSYWRKLLPVRSND